MKHFLKNPYSYFLSLLGYEMNEKTLLTDYLTRFTHSTYFEDRMNNNDLEKYTYKLYS